MTGWLGTMLLSALCAITAAHEPPPSSKPPSVEVGADGTVTVRGKVTFTDRNRDIREKVKGSVHAMLWYAIEDVQVGSWTGSGEYPSRTTASSKGRVEQSAECARVCVSLGHGQLVV
ncbi:MAG TPA: hypothetical protein VFD82_22430 [Planctomycetota bacterium]|nr:hypothetical protein [Planctomycetota bacterium]